MIEKIESIDQNLFLYLNSFHADWLDPIMMQVSNKLFWIPLYLLLFCIVQRRFGWKNMGWFALLVALTILFCDQLSSTVLKQYFARYRPCNNLDLKGMVHTFHGHCGSGFSFVSGHAANYFGLTTLLASFMKKRNATILLLTWAALIAYSRVYLGLHYPADILFGGLLGVVIGRMLYQLNGYTVRKSKGKIGLDELNRR
jgi:undecaprenyl-diphosphatase